MRATLENGEIVSLRERTEAASNKFVAKVYKNPKFANWFPGRENTGRNLRGRRPVQEKRSKTERYFKWPIALYRRRIDDLIDSGTVTLNAVLFPLLCCILPCCVLLRVFFILRLCLSAVFFPFCFPVIT